MKNSQQYFSDETEVVIGNILQRYADDPTEPWAELRTIAGEVYYTSLLSDVSFASLVRQKYGDLLMRITIASHVEEHFLANNAISDALRSKAKKKVGTILDNNL